MLTWWAVYHILTHDFGSPQKKFGWAAACVFAPFLGVLMYIVWGRKQGRKISTGVNEIEEA